MLKFLPHLAARVLALVLFSLSLDTAHGQTAALVRDINTTGRSVAYSTPDSFYSTGGKLFFFGLGSRVTGVWASDGTPEGTTLLADICSNESCQASYPFLGDLGGTVFWVGTTEGILRRLWRSDGTRAGTFPLTGPGTGIPSTAIFPGSPTYAFFKGAFYFQGCQDEFESNCQRSYRSDGSAAGTVEIEPLGSRLIAVGDRLFSASGTFGGPWELRATSDPSAGSTVLAQFVSEPKRLTAVGSRLFFTAAAPPQEPEQLWVSDGTVAGTRQVTGFTSVNPFDSLWDWLEQAGNRVYFVADDGVHGLEIWVSDGTAKGTRRVTELSAFTPFPRTPTLEEVNGRLVFAAVDDDGLRLWAAGATPESTVQILCSSCDLLADPVLVKAGGRVFFQAGDPGHGVELWSTDGTAAGTGLTVDLRPGPEDSMAQADQLQPWPGGLLLRGARDATHGHEIWLGDGTADGLRRATDFADGRALDPIYHLPPAIPFQGKAWFSVNLSLAGGLWSTSGDPSSTRLVALLNHSEPFASPTSLTAGGSSLYFWAYDGSGTSLWATQGTSASTVKLSTAVELSDSEVVAAGGGLVYFLVNETLWRSDGTVAGTFALRSHPHLSEKGAIFQGRLYFTVWNELWMTDGTVPGTQVAFRHEHVQSPLGTLVANGAIYFTAVDQDGHSELWRSDGTEAGTVRLEVLAGTISSLTPSGSSLYFSGNGYLWKSDGTGTSQILDGFEGSQPQQLTAVPGGIAFYGSSTEGLSLFRSDGTAAGTVRLHAFEAEASRPVPMEVAAIGGRLFFSGWDAIHGYELWTSDGTAAGTAILRDLYPGWRSSLPHELIAAGGRLFFVAHDGAHGNELWQSDGTAAGTRLVQDLYPTADSSNPAQLTVAGDNLYFVADDGLTGFELWSYPLTAGPGCQPSASRLCLNNGRFQVEAAWKDFQGNRGNGQAVTLTPDTGYFWFFSPANVEAVLKVLDGRGLNNHFWTFYGALSSVEYHLTVTDTQTGAAKRYYNPPGQLASVGDTNGFGPLGAFSSKVLEPLTLIDSRVAPVTGPCLPTAERLCLNGRRFAVEANWKDFQGKTGAGKSTVLTNDTGWFWFFDPANVEVMIKVLDGTSLNGKHWVFYGALSSVEYTITVTDTQTGVQKIYKNPSGTLASVADTNAF